MLRIIYEILIGVSISEPLVCEEGFIWCTDGSFMDLTDFRFSNKEALGYVIGNNVAISLYPSDKCLSWDDAEEYCKNHAIRGVKAEIPPMYYVWKISDMIKSFSKYIVKMAMEGVLNRKSENILSLFLARYSRQIDIWTCNKVDESNIVCLNVNSGEFNTRNPSCQECYVLPIYRFGYGNI